MITFENKLLVTNNINLALVQYGHNILKDIMKTFIYPFPDSNEINEELEGIWEDLLANGSVALDSIDILYRYCEVTFNKFDSGKKTALYYFYLNNSNYLNEAMDTIESEGDDFEEILGRVIAEEIYYAENKNELYKGLISFLSNHLTNLISNLNQIDEELDISDWDFRLSI